MSDTPVVHLREIDIPDATTEACQHTINVLRGALERAEAGELTGVMLIGELGTGETLSMWSYPMDFRDRLGRLEALKLTWWTQSQKADDDE